MKHVFGPCPPGGWGNDCLRLYDYLLVRSRTLAEALYITLGDLITALDCLTEDHENYTELTTNMLDEAIKNVYDS